MDNLSCRVLLVEDNEDDYLIVRDLLGDIATTQFDLEWVDTYQGAREALSHHQYDVCFLDYRLGESTGVELVREFAGGDTPLILLTGNEDYEVDVEAAQAGAADYLIKGHINALLMERSIRYAIEHKKSVAALLQAQRFAQATVDALPDSIAVLDEQGTIVAVNAVWREFAASNGFTGAACGIGMNYLRVCGRSDEVAGDATAAGIRAVIAAEAETFSLEYPCHSPSEQRWFQMSATRFSGDGPTHVVVAHENITERKLAEQQLQIHSRLLNVIGQAVVVTDRAGIITYWNECAEELYGWSSGEAVGRNVLDVTPTDATQGQAAQIMACLVRGESWSGEFTAQKRDGSTFPIYVTDTPVLDETGRVASIIGISLDISERKHAEERLRQSEANLTKAQQIARLGSWEMDLLNLDDINANSLHWSDEAFRIFGYQPGQIESSKENFFGVVHPDDRERIQANMAQTIHEGRPYSLDHRVLLADDTERIVHEQAEIICDEGTGRPLKLVGTVQDITEQKQMQESLHQERDFVSAVVDTVGSLIIVLDGQGRIVRFNRACEQLTGYAFNEVKGREFWDLFLTPEEMEMVQASFQELCSGQFPNSHVNDWVAKDGSRRLIAWTNTALTDAQGAVEYVIGTGTDITQQKQAEAALHEREEFQRTLLENFPNGSVNVFDRDLRYVLAAGRGLERSGIDPKQIVGKTLDEMYAPEQVTLVKPYYEKVLADQTVEFELPYGKRLYNINAAPLHGHGGEVVNIIAVAQDITERKRAEAALQKGEQEQRQLAERLENERARLAEAQAVAKLGSWELDLSTNALSWSDQNYRIFGVDRDKFGASYEAFLQLIHPDDRAAVNNAYAESVANHTPYAIDHRLLMEDGSFKTVHERCQTFYDDAGRAVRSVGTTQDISERKQAEAELQFQKTLLEAQMETSLDGILVISDEGKILSYNQRFVQMWEIPQQVADEHDDARAMATVLNKLVNPQQFVENVKHLYQNRDECSHEEIALRDGRIFDRYSAPISSADGFYYGGVCYFRDITARKEASAAMTRLAAIVESSSDAIISKTLDGIITSWNAGAQALYGYSPHETIGRCVSMLVPPDRPDEMRWLLGSIEQGERVTNYETVRVCKDGRHLDVALTLSPLKDEAGAITGASAIARDITERKQAEAQLHFQKTLLEAQTETSLDGILAVSDEGRILSYNQRFVQMWEIPQAVIAAGEDAPLIQIVLDKVVNARRFLEKVTHLYGHRDEQSHDELMLRDSRIFDRYSAPITSADGSYYGRVWYFRDITERKLAEASLRYSEERYRSLALTTNQIVWTAPADGMIEDMPTWRDFTGQSIAEVQGWGWTEALHPDDAEAARDIWLHCVETKSHYDTEYRIRAADGHYRLFVVRGVPILESDGSIREWVGTCSDIHDRRMAEEERDRFFTLSLDMLAIIGSDGYMKRLNPAFETTLGFSSAEMMAVPFLEFVHPDDHAATLEALATLVSGAQLMPFENRYRCRDGSYKWLRWMCAPFEDLWYCVAHDITGVKQAAASLHEANDTLELRVEERTAELHAANESLQAEILERKAALEALHHVAEAFRATQERLQSVTNHIPQAIFWKDLKGTYMGCNNRMAQDAGYDSPDEILGKNDFDLPWAEHAAAYRADDAQVMDTDTPKLNIEEPLVKADGAKIWLRTNKVPLHDNEGAVVGVLASYEDITLQKEAEAAIHQAREEAEAANLAKSEFLSRMSHELRTPLNAILGFGQILEMRAASGDPKHRESIRQILKAGRHLLSLINEVLDIARIEAGHLSLSLEPICAGTVVQETLDLVRPLAAERQIHLVNKIVGENAERHLLADQQRFKQVLLNLLSNAVKYNREGGSVVVCCEVIPSAPLLRDGIQYEGHLRILVRDTGDGLSPQDIAKLFTPFERLGAADGQIEGTGIGLTLCKRLVEAMEGRIGVESQVGQGSSFWVEMPLVSSPMQRAAQLEDGQVDASDSAAEVLGTILYIEDNLSNISLVEHALSSQNYEVRFLTAMQGLIGVQLATQHTPDLILLDVHLPDIVGDEVLRRLKANASTRNIPVVVLSADATPSQVERLLSGGAEAYLTKPLDLKQFFDVVEQFLEKPA